MISQKPIFGRSIDRAMIDAISFNLQPVSGKVQPQPSNQPTYANHGGQAYFQQEDPIKLKHFKKSSNSSSFEQLMKIFSTVKGQ